MKIVVDTNALVSGLLNPYGAAGEIVRMISAGLLIVYYDARIISEYKEVLRRGKFEFNQNQVEDMLRFLQSNGEIALAKPLKSRLPDIHDEMFLEVAIAAKARCLITGNIKHYPVTKRQGMSVESPSEFIELYRKES